MKIVLDAMGGDFAPRNEVQGAIDALKGDANLEIILVGNKNILDKELAKHELNSRISIVDAPERISMKELPTQAIKKDNSSLMTAIRVLKNGEADALVSSGNTGALLAGSVLKLGRIKNVDRPAIVAVFLTMSKPLVALDLGANVDCKPRQLFQFAKMGSIYSKSRFGIANPKVRLLNIGEEETKGNEALIETHKLLKEEKDINFLGNLEPFYLLNSDTDVVVCDGFVGNVVLKLGEGMISNIFSMIKNTVKKSIFSIFGSIFMLPSLKKIKKKFDYDEFGGTLLIGVKKPVLKAHGSASPKAIMNAIKEATIMGRENVVDTIKVALADDDSETSKEG
jgi:phosphate acyltransferase